MNDAIETLGSVLLHFLWQGAAIALSAWIALRLLRQARPQARYAVLCAAMSACLLAPAISLWRALAVPMATRSPWDQVTRLPWTDVLSPAANVVPAGPWPPEVLPWVVAIWTVGAAVMLLRIVSGLRWVRRVRHEAGRSVPDGWQARFDALARRFGLDRLPLRIGPDGEGPMTIGVWRPVVLVPAALFANMPVELLEALLAHELAHIRRHDYLINLLQRITEALLFYHPAIWWLSRRLTIERELIADRLAADALGEPRKLALALSQLDRLQLSTIPHLAQTAHGGSLMSRIEALVRPGRLSGGGLVLFPVIGLLAAGVAFYVYADAKRAPIIPIVGHAAALPESVGPGPDAIAMADSVEEDGIESSDEDFIRFRHQGGTYVVRDPAILARVKREEATAEAYTAQVRALEAEMQAQSERIEAIGHGMGAARPEHMDQTPAMREAVEKLEALARQQAELAEQHAMQANRAPGSEAKVAEQTRELEAMDRKMQALDVQIQQQQSIVEQQSAQMAARMDAMGEEIERATKPMEELARKMDVLAIKQQQAYAQADQRIRTMLEQAIRDGKAQPADASSPSSKKD